MSIHRIDNAKTEKSLRELLSAITKDQHGYFKRSGFAWGDPDLPRTDTTLDVGRHDEDTFGYHSVRLVPNGGLITSDGP